MGESAAYATGKSDSVWLRAHARAMVAGVRLWHKCTRPATGESYSVPSKEPEVGSANTYNPKFRTFQHQQAGIRFLSSHLESNISKAKKQINTKMNSSPPEFTLVATNMTPSLLGLTHRAPSLNSSPLEFTHGMNSASPSSCTAHRA